MAVFCRYTPIKENSIMDCRGNHAFKHSQNKVFFLWTRFLGMPGVRMNNLTHTHGILSWGSKVSQIRSQDTCYMIIFSGFQRFFLHFLYFFHPQNTISSRFFEDFFSVNQDTFLILKLLITFLKELVLGQVSFSAKCTGK